MTGYSGTPLYKKLGISEGASLCILHAPDEYRHSLIQTYSNAVDKLTNDFDWLQAFYTNADQLKQDFPNLKVHLKTSGQLWISWPKKSSMVSSDLSENVIRQIGLNNGLVDVKVAAIDETWSGLKFIYRLIDR